MAEYLDFFNVYIMGVIEVSFQIYWHVVFLSAMRILSLPFCMWF